MMKRANAWLKIGAILMVASLPAFGAVKTATPEPSLVVLTAAGVGAIVLIARKKRGR